MAHQSVRGPRSDTAMRVNTEIGGNNGMDVSGNGNGSRFRISAGTLLLFLGNLVFVVAWLVSLNSAQQNDRRRIEELEKKDQMIDVARGQLPLIQQRLNMMDTTNTDQNRVIERNQQIISELQRQTQELRFYVDQLVRQRDGR